MELQAERVALLADIHGNSLALDAVLRDIESTEVDARVLMGDYFLFGPRPREVHERLAELDWPAIEGNTDRYIAGPTFPAPFTDLREWYRTKLGEEALEWCCNLPFDLRVRSGDGGELLIVHATPTDIEDLLITEQDEWQTHPLTTEEKAAGRLGDASADLIVYGHIHYTSSGTLDKRSLASIGSVGLPFDGDHRAAYAIAEWNNAEWTLEHRRVEYDHESVAREVRTQGLPLAEARAQRLELARPVPLLPHLT
jgi:diadenosine tetraphosphatase ApaH/serine/threonine PP2A family protein phosphatase